MSIIKPKVISKHYNELLQMLTKVGNIIPRFIKLM